MKLTTLRPIGAKKFEVLENACITSVAIQAYDFVRTTKQPMQFDFNGIKITLTPSTSNN